MQGFVGGQDIMKVRYDDRTGNVYARPSFKLADGSTVRRYVTPGEFDLPNTARGLEEAVRRMAVRLSTTTVNPNPNPSMETTPPPVVIAPKEVPTFKTFAEESWLPRNLENKPATRKQKRKIVRALNKHFGALRLDEIDTRSVDEWIKRVAGYASTTRGVYATGLRSILLLAREYRYVVAVPKIPAKAPRNVDGYVVWNEDECARVAAEARSPFRELIEFAEDTGLRIGELRALPWTCVLWEAKEVRVAYNLIDGHLGTPKGNRERRVPLSDRAYKLLVELKKKAVGPYVFADANGKRLGRNALYKELKRAAAAAGLPLPRGRAFHVLRHKCGTTMAVVLNVPPTVIQAMLGHSDIRETQRYMHATPESLTEAAAALNEYRAARARTRQAPTTSTRTEPQTLRLAAQLDATAGRNGSISAAGQPMAS